MGCPGENDVVDFVQGKLDRRQAAAIESHLDGCPGCLELVSELARIYSADKPASMEATAMASRAGSGPTPGSDGASSPLDPFERTSPIVRGVSLGRYVVLDPVGSGGMGVVYAAYDPELDRKIALKVLRDVGEEHRRRLLREGRAMARLSHPNVITVHDVGTYEGRPYVAMEFVDGETLGTWQRRERRRWQDVLKVYAAAGEGLAAAHAAGLVHRDFKPANVLVARDGRVRVTDFGLARPDAEQAERTAAEPEPLSTGESAVTVSLTRTGAVVGTPAYMSPEQYELRSADARSDQFSFCVGLFEGLYGHRPYEGRSMAELATRIVSGEIQLPSDHRGAPRRILETLRRGLSKDPGDRFPDMASLLAELRRDPTARWRRLGIVGGPIVLGAAGVASVVMGDDPMCRDARARVGEAWDEARRERVRAAFAAVDASFSDDAWTSVSRALDGYADTWTEGWTDACEATHMRHEQSEQLLDLRMLCLADRRAQLSALTTILTTADEKAVQRSVDAAYALPPVSTCANVEALTAPIPPPDDPTKVARVRELQADLARADALRSASGKFEEASRIATAVAEEATAIGYAPLQARALHRVATLKSDAVREQEARLQALEAAIAARDDRVAAVSAIELFGLASADPRRDPEARAWLGMAEALARRMGDDESVMIRVLEKRALRAGRRGDFEEGLRLAREVVRRVEAFEGPDHVRVAVALGNLGQVLQRAGKLDEAITAQRRALAIDEAARGPEHPDISLGLNNLAAAHLGSGDYAEAVPLLERAVRIRERAFGPDDPRILSALTNLAEALRGLGRLEDADEKFRRALAIGEALPTWDEGHRASLYVELGITAYYRGEAASALRHYERALAIREERDGPNAPATATVRYNAGETLEVLGRLDEALEHHRRALEDMQAVLGEAHPHVAYPMGGIGRVHLERGDLGAAIPVLERALSIHERASAPARERLVVRLALARARRQEGDLEQARLLAGAAATEAEEAGVLALDLRAQVERLLGDLAAE